MYVHFYNLNNISKFYKRKITPIYIPSTTYKLALDIFHGACELDRGALGAGGCGDVRAIQTKDSCYAEK